MAIKHRYAICYNQYDLRYAMYLGLMIITFLYNSFIDYVTKDRVYLYYILYILYISLAIPISNGDFHLHFKILYNYFPVYSCLGYLLPTLFAFQYLEIKHNSKGFYVSILTLTGIQIFLAFLYLIGLLKSTEFSTYSYYVSIIYNLTLCLVGIYLWVRGNKNARFYTIAWTSVLSVSVYFFLVLLQLVPSGEYLSNLMYLGYGLETIFFSLALGDRMTILQKQQQQAQNMEQKMLRAQMSPHFIFNAMAAIQDFMLQNNSKQAAL